MSSGKLQLNSIDESLDQFLNLDQIAENTSDYLMTIENYIPLSESNTSDLVNTVNEKINRLMKIIIDDVSLSKDRLYALNSSRVALIEKRIDSIARKIATQNCEKYNSTVKLSEVIKNSFKSTKRNHPVQLAWHAFLSEVALYNIFELFILKSLDFFGIRYFDASDIKKLNFAIHNILTLKASGFNHDKHSWNFVRNNIYSWYTPSSEASDKIETLLSEMEEKSPLSWSDLDMLNWIKAVPSELHIGHLQFYQGYEQSSKILDIIENKLQIPFSYKFKGHNLFSKIFIPALGRSGLALGLIDIFLKRISGNLTSTEEEDTLETNQIQNALWFCEPEALELYWTEVMSLLKVIKLTSSDRAIHSMNSPTLENSNFKIPQIIHSVHTLGLELHNIDELPLKGSIQHKYFQGSAAKIQQFEMFDLSIVADCPERSKSQAWMQSLSEQLPYWKNFISSNTNINWGETHLLLAISKLKENGRCLYLTSKPMPDLKDGEKMRKAILSECILESMIEITENSINGFNYIYVFKKITKKELRDEYRTTIGKVEDISDLNINSFEKSFVIHSDLLNNGFSFLNSSKDNLILKHFENHFPKLFQIAHVRSYSKAKSDLKMNTDEFNIHSFNNNNTIYINKNSDHYIFSRESTEDSVFEIIPHNSNDADIIFQYLNTQLIQRWLVATQKLYSNGTIKGQDFKNIPMIDFSNISQSEVQYYAEIIGTLFQVESDNSEIKLNSILNSDEISIENSTALIVAYLNRINNLDKLLLRYKPFFIDSNIHINEQPLRLKPESITHFYPERLLHSLNESKEVKITYKSNDRCNIPTNLWFINDVLFESDSKNHRIVLNTKMNTQIIIQTNYGLYDYILNQIESLLDHSFGELLHLIKVPSDVSLFVFQTQEITKFISQTVHQIELLRNHVETQLNKLYL